MAASLTGAVFGSGDGVRVLADVGDAVADLLGVARDVDEGMVAATRAGTAYLLARVKSRASGRPGPRVQTGDYRRGIRSRDGFTRSLSGRLVAVGEVFSSSPQAARLEFGFVGADALGRVYNQPAYPHFGPAVADAEEFLSRAAEQAVNRGTGR